MERGSDKHGQRQDDQLAHEVEGMMRAERSTHAEEWRDPEPAGEDQPDADLAPNGTLVGGTPPGMTEQDVEGRSQLATYLGKDIYPAAREALLERATDSNAPDAILDQLRRLPDGQEFENVNEVWVTLGGGVEEHRY
jgi:Protein of unknown function (DUF2795)